MNVYVRACVCVCAAVDDDYEYDNTEQWTLKKK